MSQIKTKTLIIFFMVCLLIPTIQAAPPSGPEQYQTTLESDSSVYVSESQPTTNFNSGTNMFYLEIYQDEFMYQKVSFVKFDLSSLPEDADVLDAEIRLYLTASPDSSSVVDMYPISQSWSEGSVTWNSKPSYTSGGIISSLSVSTSGWKEWDASSVVDDWMEGTQTNYGVAFVTEESIPRFRSDESSFKPRLWILYETESGEEPEEPPEEPPEDTTPCEITYTISPENPESGDEVTISATATDNIGLEYLAIKESLTIELCSSYAEDDTTTELTCEHAEVLYTPGKTFYIEANDLGSASAQLIEVNIDIAGTGSDPVVTLDIEFEEDNAIPAKHRLLPMDGQRIDITATATDPDGIDFMTITVDGLPVDFSYDPPQTEVEETLSVYNGVDVLDEFDVPCTLRYSVRAYDIEDRSTRVEGEDIEIGAPWQWYWGLPFANWGCDENHTWSWSMMESIFGNEVWWNKERGWRKPHADYLFQNKVKEGGRGGQCYGFCALSLELADPSSSLYANMIQPTAVTIDDLERENWNNTWPYYYARQAGQYSFDRLFLKSVQYLLQPEYSGSGLHPFIGDILGQIIDDLNAGTPGIISIFEGSSGHAVVPWRVVPLGSNMYNVFIYDPNHNYVSTIDSTDYSNFEQYPFIVFGEDGWARNGWWSYEWNSTSTWNENIYYTPYETVIGNRGSINYIGTSPTAVGITDQKLPDPLQTLMYGSGDASFYVEDESGRKTGYVNGELVADIPNSAPLFESMGASGLVDMFMLPSNVTLTIHTESTIDANDEMGVYSLMLWHNSSLYTFKNMSCTKDTEDEIIFTPLSSSKDMNDHSLILKRGNVQKLRGIDPLHYSITFVKEFYNSPKKVGREYVTTSNQNDDGAEIELFVSKDYDDLVLQTFDTPFSGTISLKSTESVENDSSLGFIPESTGVFSLDANETLVVTPEDWKTTSASGALINDDAEQDQQDDTQQDQQDESTDISTQTPGFEIYLVFLVLILGMLFIKKRKQ